MFRARTVIGPSGQVEFAASGMFVSEVVEQGTVVREMSNIESDHGGHLRLEHVPCP